MKFEDKLTLADLKKIIGKTTKFRTALGQSMSHIIEEITINSDGLVLSLRDTGGRIKKKKLDRISQLEI